MDERDILERRRVRQRRIHRATTRGRARKSLLASPVTAVFTMTIALGSILVFWGGLPSWALLALGFGAVLILIVATLFLRRRSPSLSDGD